MVLKVAEDIKRQRIYAANMGGFSDSANYEFIAEFESKKLTGNYVEFMRGKKRRILSFRKCLSARRLRARQL